MPVPARVPLIRAVEVDERLDEADPVSGRGRQIASPGTRAPPVGGQPVCRAQAEAVEIGGAETHDRAGQQSHQPIPRPASCATLSSATTSCTSGVNSSPPRPTTS